MKYNLRRQQEAGEEEGDSDNEIQQLKQKIRLRRQQIRRSRLPPCANSQQRKAAWQSSVQTHDITVYLLNWLRNYQMIYHFMAY